MLNRLLSFVLLAALIGSNCSRFFIYAGFEANQNYIAKELCVNKARTWMNCNGHCYLMKKLKQAEEKEKKQERDEKRNMHQEALPAQPAIAILKKLPKQRKTYPLAPTPALLQQTTSIFQPPKVA